MANTVYTYGRLAGCPRPPIQFSLMEKQETKWGGLRTAVAPTLLLVSLLCVTLLFSMNAAAILANKRAKSPTAKEKSVF